MAVFMRRMAFLSSILIMMMLSGCTGTQQAGLDIDLKNTPQPSETFIPTPSKTPTATSTDTPTPTPSETPTMTPSPTSVFDEASIFSVDWLASGHLMVSLDIPGVPDYDFYAEIAELEYSCRMLENQTDRLICVGQALEPDKEYLFTLYNSLEDELFADMIYVAPRFVVPAGSGGICPSGTYPDYDGITGELNACCPSGTVFWGLPFNKCCPWVGGCT